MTILAVFAGLGAFGAIYILICNVVQWRSLVTSVAGACSLGVAMAVIMLAVKAAIHGW
jgi:hypothetical protein